MSRRLARHAFTVLTALSVLLCGAAVASWIGGWHWSPSPVWR